jgi:hypothetical protein
MSAVALVGMVSFAGLWIAFILGMWALLYAHGEGGHK